MTDGIPDANYGAFPDVRHQGHKGNGLIEQPSSANRKEMRRFPFWAAVVLAAAYLLAGALLIDPYLTNADAVSYVTIAQKYARGDFAGAVNGYWAPLLSWLLALPLLVGANPVLAAKVLNLLAGLALAAGLFVLGRRFGLSRGLRLGLALLSLPIILFRYALGHISPDLTVAAILIFYLDLVFAPDFFESRAAWPWAGVLGAAAYFAKSYAFFFVLVHFVVLSMIRFWETPRGPGRRRVIGKAGGALLVFLALSGAWITALSLKYGRLTISNSGSIAFGLQAPDSQGHFTSAPHLIAPPEAPSVSAWEDPSLELRPGAWEPLASAEGSRHFLAELWGNGRDILSILGKFSLWSFVLIPLAALLSFWPRKHRPAFLAFVTLAIYSGGYMIVGVNSRYLYLDEVLVLLLGGYVLGLALGRNGRGSRALAAGSALALALPFLLTPYSLSGEFRANHPGLFGGESGGPGPAVHRISRRVIDALDRYDPPKSRGHRPLLASDCCYQNTLSLAYYAGCGYAGIIPGKDSPADAERELREMKVDYLVLWDVGKKRYPFLAACPQVTGSVELQPRLIDVSRLWKDRHP